MSQNSSSDLIALASKLSPKQKQCLRLVLQHKTSKEMAKELGVTSHAVDMRLRTAMAALGVSSRLEAANILARAEKVDIDSRFVYRTPDMALSSHVADHQQHGLTSLSERTKDRSCLDNAERISPAYNQSSGDDCQTFDKPDVWDVLCNNFIVGTGDGKPGFVIRRMLFVFTIVVASLFSFSSFVFAMKLLATWD